MGIGTLVIAETDIVAGQKIFKSTENARNAQVTTWANDEVKAKAVDLDSVQTIAGKKTFVGGLDAGSKVLSNTLDPVANQDASTKAYVDTERKSSVNGVQTKVYTKYITGVLDNDDETIVAHGISGGVTSILNISVMCGDGTRLLFTENFLNGNADVGYNATVDDTSIYIRNVGSDLRTHGYKIKIDYIV
jgi:hypothetical protein